MRQKWTHGGRGYEEGQQQVWSFWTLGDDKNVLWLTTYRLWIQSKCKYIHLQFEPPMNTPSRLARLLIPLLPPWQQEGCVVQTHWNYTAFLLPPRRSTGHSRGAPESRQCSVGLDSLENSSDPHSHCYSQMDPAVCLLLSPAMSAIVLTWAMH